MWRWLAKAQLSYYCIAPIVGKNRLYSVNLPRTRCVLVVHPVHLNKQVALGEL